ncbi:MAG: hypothetical protein SFW35_07955 [Chitinophagales bacterium]|nr:hypothetical protein [Chitinophagales bacterium]
MLFSEVIGQERLKGQMLRSIAEGRVSHAQLFLGPLGHGGLPLALAYAQYLTCTQREEGDACGKCSSCSKAAKLIHPDIHFSFPFPAVEGRKICAEFLPEWREAVIASPYLNLHQWLLKFNAENKQANITASECRDIIRRLNLSAFESAYKVMIIWLPEFLGKEGNTLLKILEEPPDNTVFLLVAEKHDQMLNTILSRTQITKIPALDHPVLAAVLENELALDSDNALRIASLSNGDYIEATALAQHAVNEQAGMFREWLGMMLSKHDPLALINWIEGFAAIGREGQKNFFSYGLYLLEEALSMSISGSDSNRLQPTEVKVAKAMNHLVADLISLQKLYQLFNDSSYHIERNAHPKILMLNLSLQVARLLGRNG